MLPKGRYQAVLLKATGAVGGLSIAVMLILTLMSSKHQVSAVFAGAVILALIWIIRMKPSDRVPWIVPKVHFPGLNGLRFVAAFMVILHHIEQVKLLSGFESLWLHEFWGRCFVRLGELGVSFFFVLSGFLITYLLVNEQHHTMTIRLKDFYIRRALRIWPVYFLLTALSFFLFPHVRLLDVMMLQPVLDADFWPKFALYMSLSTHLATVFYPGVRFGNALWSTSVEEHFYFIWPLVIRAAKSRIVIVLLGIVVLSVALKQLLPIWYFLIDPDASLATLRSVKKVGYYFTLFRFDCMAIGALGAVFYFQKSRLLKYLYHPASNTVVLLAGIYCVCRGVHFGIVNDDVYSLLFIFIILNVATNPRSFLKLENPFFEFLGKISYGLYAYNWVAIVIAINSMAYFGTIQNFYLRNLYIYTVSMGLLIIFSAASYYLMERVFLRMKVRFGSASAGSIPISESPTYASKAVLSGCH